MHKLIFSAGGKKRLIFDIYVYMCYWIHLTAIMTRWPGAFSRVVPEGDALAVTLGLESAKRYCDHKSIKNICVFDIFSMWYCDHVLLRS